MEIWKDIAGYEGLYQVSNYGRVKSFYGSGKIIERDSDYGSYPSIALCKNGIHKSRRLHRIVAEAFIPRPMGYSEVNHKDMNRANNSVENLEWVTKKENVRHAISNKPEIIAAMNHYNTDVRPRPIAQISLDGTIVCVWKNCKEASRITGICYKNIYQVASKDEYRPGKTRSQAGGFKWEFLEKGAEYGT